MPSYSTIIAHNYSLWCLLANSCYTHSKALYILNCLNQVTDSFLKRGQDEQLKYKSSQLPCFCWILQSLTSSSHNKAINNTILNLLCVDSDIRAASEPLIINYDWEFWQCCFINKIQMTEKRDQREERRHFNKLINNSRN